MCQFVTRADKQGYEIRTIDQFKTELLLNDGDIFLHNGKKLSDINYEPNNCLCKVNISKTLEMAGYLTGEPPDRRIFHENGRWTERQDISDGDYYIIGRWQNLTLFEPKEVA